MPLPICLHKFPYLYPGGSTVLLRGKGFSKLLSLCIVNSTKGMLKMSNWKLGFFLGHSRSSDG